MICPTKVSKIGVLNDICFFHTLTLTGLGTENHNGTSETKETSSQEALAEMEVARPPQQPSPNAASMFDFNQFFNIEHIPGLVVSRVLCRKL